MSQNLSKTLATSPASSEPASPRPGYKWWVVFMLWFVCFFNYGDRQAISSVLPKLQSEFGFDKFQQGLIASAFMWVYAFGAPLAGFIGDRFRRKDLILGGCLFWSGVTVTTAWCAKLWQFVAVRALEGLGETFYFPASMSLVSDYHCCNTRSKAMSLHQSSVYAGTIAGSWVAAWLAQRYGWRCGFYLFGTSGMVLALVLFRFLREPRRGQSEAAAGGGVPPVPLSVSETAAVIFRRPSALLLLATFLGANFVATIFLTWTTTFLAEKFHFELAAAALYGIACINVPSAVAAPLGGAVADVLSRRHPGGRIMVQATGLLLGSVFVSTVGATSSVSLLFTAMALFGFCKGLYDSNLFASLYDVIEPRARGTAAGIMNTVGWGGGALGPLVVGWLAKHGHRKTQVENMSQAISYTGVIYIAGAALLIVAIAFFVRRDVAARLVPPPR